MLNSTIKINTASITNAVAITSQYVANDGEFKNLIVISGAKSYITVYARNSAERISMKKISFTGEQEFETFSVDGKKLLTILKAAKTEEVIFKMTESSLTVVSGGFKAKLEMAEPQEIKIEGNHAYLSLSQNLVEDLKKSYHAIDSDNPKRELNGCLIQVKNNTVSIVATDTRRLAVCSSKTSDDDIEMIVPKSAVATILKLFHRDNNVAEVGTTTLTVTTETVSYSTNLLNGKFPEWKRIIPESFKQTATLDRKAFAELIKEVSLFEQQINISIKNGKVTITDKDGNMEVVDDHKDLKLEIQFTIIAKILLDFLTSYDGEIVELGFNNANLPIQLQGDIGYKEICMPIIIKAEEVDNGKAE